MPTTLQAGDPAPPFELLTSEGVPYSLSAARGSNVVIYFYPKADTPG
jgi:peroxiredoxin Q/BCP